LSTKKFTNLDLGTFFDKDCGSREKVEQILASQTQSDFKLIYNTIFANDDSVNSSQQPHSNEEPQSSLNSEPEVDFHQLLLKKVETFRETEPETGLDQLLNAIRSNEIFLS
jgi:hypothetical protein